MLQITSKIDFDQISYTPSYKFLLTGGRLPSFPVNFPEKFQNFTGNVLREMSYQFPHLPIPLTSIPIHIPYLYSYTHHPPPPDRNGNLFSHAPLQVWKISKLVFYWVSVCCGVCFYDYCVCFCDYFGVWFCDCCGWVLRFCVLQWLIFLVYRDTFETHRPVVVLNHNSRSGNVLVHPPWGRLSVKTGQQHIVAECLCLSVKTFILLSIYNERVKIPTTK